MGTTTNEASASLGGLRERGQGLFEASVAASSEFRRLTVEWAADGERKLLVSLLAGLRELEARVAKRLSVIEAELSAPVEASESPVLSAPAAPATPAAEAGPAAPFEDYDIYTAKEIVAELVQLSAEAASAVLDYERAHKARATVIRAAEQKLFS